MLRGRQRWITIACFASWALGPAIGIAYAAHELEHHGLRAQDHSHAAQAAEAFLHGHVHDDNAGDHGHELVPPSLTPSRLGQPDQVAPATVSSATGWSRPESVLRFFGSPPEPTALAPPDFSALCVLRL